MQQGPILRIEGRDIVGWLSGSVAHLVLAASREFASGPVVVLEKPYPKRDVGKRMSWFSNPSYEQA